MNINEKVSETNLEKLEKNTNFSFEIKTVVESTLFPDNDIIRNFIKNSREILNSNNTTNLLESFNKNIFLFQRLEIKYLFPYFDIIMNFLIHIFSIIDDFLDKHWSEINFLELKDSMNLKKRKITINQRSKSISYDKDTDSHNDSFDSKSESDNNFIEEKRTKNIFNIFKKNDKRIETSSNDKRNESPNDILLSPKKNDKRNETSSNASNDKNETSNEILLSPKKKHERMNSYDEKFIKDENSDSNARSLKKSTHSFLEEIQILLQDNISKTISYLIQKLNEKLNVESRFNFILINFIQKYTDIKVDVIQPFYEKYINFFISHTDIIIKEHKFFDFSLTNKQKVFFK
jgi:hypothetical protein